MLYLASTGYARFGEKICNITGKQFLKDSIIFGTVAEF